MTTSHRPALRTVVIALVLLAIASAFGAACQPSAVGALPPKPRLRVATTTSLYDTGLWGYLEPMFEAEYGIELDIIYAGTGKALEYGRRGDVHAVTVHARPQEEEFIAAGYGARRVAFAYNHFLLVGPPDDPAGVSGMSPQDAFRRISQDGDAPFLSRGDDSGTHLREQAIWRLAGLDYESIRSQSDWYIEAGTGMGPALMMASEKRAYTLTDIGTFLAFRGRLDLITLVEQGDSLLNVYAAITVSSDSIPEDERHFADDLIDFLTSEKVQDLIGEYGRADYGRALFIPSGGVDPEPSDQASSGADQGADN